MEHFLALHWDLFASITRRVLFEFTIKIALSNWIFFEKREYLILYIKSHCTVKCLVTVFLLNLINFCYPTCHLSF